MSLMLVIGLAALASLALGLLLLPLFTGQRRPPPRDAYNLAVYREQLAEIDRDLGRRLLTSSEAEAARAEIGRRILALERTRTETVGTGRPLAAAVVSVLVLPLAALLLYARLGSPSLPDQPLAARRAATSGQHAGTAASTGMEEALAKLRAHLQARPEDLTGWVLLARSEVGLGKFQAGAEAYRRAAELSEQRPDIVADWGEALVLVAEGAVTPAAVAAFEIALKDPESAPRSRYYLALAKLQQGDARGALRDWTRLAADTPEDAAWLPVLRQRIAEVAAAQGIDPASVMPAEASPPRTAAGSPPTASGMPSQDAVASVATATAGASPQERLAMVEGMVERLASRLQEQPDDAEGWARLGRSYMVLQQPGKAREAYGRAVTLRPDDAALAKALLEATEKAAAAETGRGGAPAVP